MKLFFECILLLLLLQILNPLVGQELPQDYFVTIFAEDFQRPRGMDYDEAGNMYLFEHGGTIWKIDTAGNRLSTPFLDLREQVSAWFDHGLLGMCLDKDFSTTGHFYVLYAVDRYWYEYQDSPGYRVDSSMTNAATWGRVSRFSADATGGFNTVLPGSELVLLGDTAEDGIPLHYNFHGLGKIRQALDGTLLISNGDGASNSTDIGLETSELTQEALDLGLIRPDQHIGSYRSQYLGSLRGKILRIDPVSGAGIPSNPFYQADAPRSPASRTWALGFRNPYRFSIKPGTGSHDPATGDPGVLYVGDVGNGGWEELNICDAGGQNFGWPHYEGPKRGWAFANAPDVINASITNPLAGTNGCPPELGFKDTFIPPGHPNGDQLSNPCDPGQVLEYPGNPVITPPVLTWSNANWNLPSRAGTPILLPNGGTDFLEFNHPQSSVLGPAFGGYSAMDALFLSGSQWPADIREKLLMYDYSGWIKAISLDEEGHPIAVEDFAEAVTDIHTLSLNPVTGRLFYLTSGPFVREISFGGNPPPEARGSLNLSSGGNAILVEYSAAASVDQNHDFEELDFHWDFGDGQSSNAPTGTHLFQTTGNEPFTFRPVLTVTDPEGLSDTDTLIVSLNNSPPVVDITSFNDGDFYPLDKTNLLELTAEVSDAEHARESLAYRWETFLHHNTHFHPEESSDLARAYAVIEPLGCAEESYYVRVRLTVTDPEGLSTTIEQSVYPDCDPPRVSIEDFTLDYATNMAGVEARFAVQSQIQGTYFVQCGSDPFSLATSSVQNLDVTGEIHPGANAIDFEDKNPQNGTNFYRLKVITEDRRIHYSDLKSIQWPRPLDFTLSPNPATYSVNLTLRDVVDGQRFSFSLYDQLGHRIQTTEWVGSGTNGVEEKLILLNGNLPEATYFYRLSGDQGVSIAGKLQIVH